MPQGIFKIYTLISIFTLLLSAQPSIAAVKMIGPTKKLFKIDSIDVEGVKKVEKEAILEKIKATAGMVLDNYTLKKDIETIYDLKYFEFVEAHQVKRNGKNVLLFKVKEKPIITTISLKGNDEIDEDDLRSQIKTKQFSIFDTNTIKIDVGSLQKFYEDKGYYLASVDYEVKKLNDENVELVFVINEFEKVRVKKVTFLGNRAFTDGQLKDIMETREENLFSFMSNAGNFKEFNFQTDIERIKYFYKTKGYLQVNVGSPEITVSEDKRWVFISMKINEGPEFSVNNIYFQGEVLFDEAELLKKIELEKGAIYSEELLRKDIQMLTEMYQDKGYAFANVLRTLQVVPGENKVDIEFSFEKGKIAYFGNINIKGNSKTRDKVIRRELKIKEGQKFSGSALRRSKENVNRLGFFEPGSVIFNTKTSSAKDDVLDVDISIKERNTGQISLGAGYSTATGGFLQGSISQNNFRGLGQNLSFSLNLSESDRKFNIGFTEPYLFDSKWTAGGDIFITSNKRSNSFEFEKKGFALRVGYPIFDYTRLFMTYKYEDTSITETDDPRINEDLENGDASLIRTSIEKDKRNNAFEPSKGYYFRVSHEFAGLGGEKKWQKHEMDARYYKKVVGDLVFRSRLFAGKLEKIGGREIPRTEKYFLGGSRNLRGYAFEGVGPKSSVTVDNIEQTFNVGGEFSTFTTLEFEHPLAREAGLKWVVFFDAGDAGEIDEMKVFMDYGFGFRWFSPIGVLRFEFAYPINPDDGKSGSQFHFDIGQLF